MNLQLGDFKLTCRPSPSLAYRDLFATPLTHLYVLLPSEDPTVVFCWCPSLPASPSFDASLASLLRSPGTLPSLGGASPACVTCQEHPVALQRFGDLLYAAVAHPNDDELAAADLLGAAYRIVTAVCDEEPPSAARLAEFYGKVVVCLHEAFSGQGFQLQRSVDAILRNAKLKAPA